MSRTTGRTIPWLRATGLALALLASAACTPINRFHGFTPSAAELSTVQVGQTTRDSVVANFGPPTSEGLLEDDAYYYVSSQFRHFGAFAPEEVDRQVLAISFAEDGVVENIARFGLERGRLVVLSRRVTETTVRDVTFIRQIIRNFGRIDIGEALNN